MKYFVELSPRDCDEGAILMGKLYPVHNRKYLDENYRDQYLIIWEGPTGYVVNI